MAAMAPLEVQMGDVNAQNLGQLRTLNEHTFPVRYADKFYDEIPTLPEGLARFAYCGGFAVGNCCARLEAFRNTEEKRKKLYIMTIGVLHAYRRRGIGRKLLTQLLESAAARKDVKVIYLHVQTCVEINQCVGCMSGEEPASPRHRAGVASMAWRTTRRFSTNAP
jgi:GNAT superfamily N-acetyltransferase